MDLALTLARAAHFAGAISLSGLFAFAAFIAGPPSRGMQRELGRLGWASAALLILAAPFWLLFVARSIGTESVGATISNGTALAVLTDTRFGHVMVFRLILVLAVMPCIALVGRRRARDLAATVIACASLAAIAWQGHGGGDFGWDGAVHLSADTAHLVAAGLWLGALLPLAILLRDAGSADVAFAAARRFSTLGFSCVAVLLVSGTINAWYLVGSVPALIGTPYGQLLLAKLALVAAMLWLAAINRWVIMPRMALGEDGATLRLAYHAAIEAALGLGVIVLVAAFGTMVPAAHEQPVWPFAHRLSLEAIGSAPASRWQAIVGTALALIGVAILTLGFYRRRVLMVAIGSILAGALGWRVLTMILVPATPSSYAVSPEPFSATTIARGQALYAQNCAACHGAEGHGDGPRGAELPIVPADLTAQLGVRSEGDLYSFITEGLDGGVMPSFAGLGATERWDIVVFLEAQQQASAASSTLIADVTMSPAPRAPDFTLPAPQGDAATLAALLARGGVLLVFATLPQSQSRLDQLQQWSDALHQADIAVVAMTDAPSVRDAYALYERRPQIAELPPAPHIEFLIDRTGAIRARWRPGDTPDWRALDVLEREIAAMRSLEAPPASAPATPSGHVHEG